MWKTILFIRSVKFNEIINYFFIRTRLMINKMTFLLLFSFCFDILKIFNVFYIIYFPLQTADSSPAVNADVPSGFLTTRKPIKVSNSSKF